VFGICFILKSQGITAYLKDQIGRPRHGVHVFRLSVECTLKSKVGGKNKSLEDITNDSEPLQVHESEYLFICAVTITYMKLLEYLTKTMSLTYSTQYFILET